MTAQFPNNIHIDGKEYYLATNPLSSYLESKNITIEGYCTGCWDGYLSEWDIIDDKLYLVDVSPCFTDEEGERILTMDNLFPGQDKVFAEWYSGELLLKHGELLHYVHAGYESVYETHIRIKIEKREVAEVSVEDNRNKVFKDSYF